jgi:hypothetical protein
VAGHLIWEGMVQEGLAACGYQYHLPKGHVGFAPRLTPENFRAAFTTAEGWGTFHQTRTDATQTDRLELKWGKLRLRSLSFALDEVDSRSMQSKIVPDLYFAGELLDLDGPIGGYNFQAAFSTGWLAGESV